MSSKRFLMISIDPEVTFDLGVLERELDKAADWVQFFPHSWLVFTGRTSKTWYRRIQTVVGERRRIFVCAVDVNSRGGYMPRPFWDFLARNGGPED